MSGLVDECVATKLHVAGLGFVSSGAHSAGKVLCSPLEMPLRSPLLSWGAPAAQRKGTCHCDYFHPNT